MTETLAGVPCGVGRAGGVEAHGAQDDVVRCGQGGEVATRSTWAATLPTCHTCGWVTQTEGGSFPWPPAVSSDRCTER